jgi:hypothetical protein
MEHSQSRTLAQLERQMKAARQLRAETVARGSARALEGLSSFVRRMVERFRGAQGLSVPSWRD